MTWLILALSLYCQAHFGPYVAWDDQKLVCDYGPYESNYP